MNLYKVAIFFFFLNLGENKNTLSPQDMTQLIFDLLKGLKHSISIWAG